MSDSVVVNLLALFILFISLIATSCVVAFLRKRWLAARRPGAAAPEDAGARIKAAHAAQI